MKTLKHLSLTGILGAVALAAVGLISTVATAATVNAIYNAATDVPVIASGYTATGSTVTFTLNFAPATGTDLMVVKNTALEFINGTFDNLAQRQAVALSYGGVTYPFVANYYGGSGNDLVLVWASNRAFAWGFNDDGELGNNSKADSPLPVPVTVTGVLAGKTVVAVAAGGSHSLALCSDGALAAWGDNYLGQLGDNTGGYYGAQRLVPVAVNTNSGSALFGKTVVAIAAGAGHSLALCSDGTVAAWGWNNRGQLGDSTTTDRLIPLAVNTTAGVSALSNKTVVAIAAGAGHSLALCSDGTVAAWGYNYYGQLGDNGVSGFQSLVPVAVNTNSGSALFGKTVVAIAAGYFHNLALCTNGTVVAWGNNGSGQLGDNTTAQRNLPVTVNTNSGVSALRGKPVVAIAAGHDYSMALCSDDTVAAWGSNARGEIGDNTLIYRYVPVAVNTNSGVSALYGKPVVAIAAGDTHSVALCLDDTVAAWGYNYYAQLGDGTFSTSPPYCRTAPVAVNTTQLATGQRFTRAASGSSAMHTLALVAAPSASQITLTGAGKLTNGSFQFTFTNTPGAFFGVLAATNPALPLSNWSSLTGLTEASPGKFQLTDPQAKNSPQRFYRVRPP